MEKENKVSISGFKEVTVDAIISRVAQFQATGDLILPANYIPENAVRAAWLMLQETVDMNKRPALEVCTKESIANAFLEMVTKGLSVTKKQGYFVVYGNKLSFDVSYIGSITISKRDANVREVNAATIYADDIFEYEHDVTSGRKRVTKHNQTLANINPDKIIGAYAIVTYKDDSTDTEIMTFSQIQKSWAMGGSKGNSPAHKNFPDQMCEKTVIGRVLKIEAGSADDSAILKDYTASGVSHEIKQNANKESMSFDDAEVIENNVAKENRNIESHSEVASPGEQQEMPTIFN